MSAINLEKSLEKVKKCYIGKDSLGKTIIDPKELGDDLAFRVALHRVNLAIKNNEITEMDFINHITGENHAIN